MASANNQQAVDSGTVPPTQAASYLWFLVWVYETQEWTGMPSRRDGASVAKRDKGKIFFFFFGGG